MDGEISPRQARKRSGTAFWLAGVLLFCFTYFLPKPGDWNQNARLDLDLAIVNNHTLQIDPYHWQAGDDLLYRGHYYSNKAPGQSLIGIPVLLAYKGLLYLVGRDDLGTKMGLKYAGTVANYNFYLWQTLEAWYAVAVPTMLFLLLFFWFLGYFSRAVRNRVLLTLALGLATNMFSYSGLFYPHSSTAALLFSAFVLLFITGSREKIRGRMSRLLVERRSLNAALTGACLGMAFLFDHTSVVVSAFIGIYALTRLRFRDIPVVALAALPFLAITLGYDYLAFGNIGITGYNTEGPGLAGSDSNWPPTGYAFFGMSVSPYRGLFFLSPFLLLAFPGMALWARRGGREWLVCLIAPLVYFLAISTVWYWYGGWAVGPRYLIPTLPFLATPIIFVLDAATSRLARMGVWSLMALSVVAVWVETVSYSKPGFPPTNVHDPLFDWSLPALLRGDIRLNMGSFILGPVAGATNALTLLPLVALLACWSIYCHGRNRAIRRQTQPVPVSV